MSELPTTLPEKEVYDELVSEAKDTDDIKTLREMAQVDLASVAIVPEDGAPVDVTAIGSEKFSELSKIDPQAVESAMAVHSDDWRTEPKQ